MNRSRTFIKSLAVALLMGASLAFGSHAFAQVVDPSSGLETFGQAAGFVTTGSLTLTIARLIRTAITFLGILAVVFVLYGGFLFMTAGGNDDKVKRAKKVFTSATIGLVIVLSAFAIVQFVLGQLSSALGGGATSSTSDGGSYADGGTGGTSGTFELTSVNTDCASAIMNLQLQFTFSQRVSSSTVDADGIVVSAADGTPVEGTYAVSGRRVTFTPAKECDGYADENCFESGATYAVVVDDSILKSSGGLDLTCGTECSFGFTVGTAVDTTSPSMDMDAPEDGATVYVTNIQDLYAAATDDTGVSSVEFTIDGDSVYQAALSTDATSSSLTPSNTFHIADGTEWDTAGYTAGTYQVRAEGADCAGHTDTSGARDLVLRPAHCGNDAADADDPLTSIDESDTADNCGGDECGACDGAECATNADCSSGYCDPATLTCVGVPEIESVSPGDGAEFSLVTLSGNNFGATGGTITFLGDASVTTDDVTVSAYDCGGSTQWSDDEIVVQVSSAVVDGPIQVTTTDGYSDETDDDYGPSISDFDVNAIVRPGLCALTPSTGEAFSTTVLSGLNFGDSQGSSTVYFGNTEAYDYDGWADSEISALLPLLNAREYQTQVWSGDYTCLSADGSSSGVVCTDDTFCTDAGYASCQTSWCSGTLADCSSDSDCTDGSDCVSVRQGSNKLTFTVTDRDAGATPVISSTDSGWEACSDGTHCGSDADCGTGTCDSADNWGPPGQYVTIYGSGFGSSTGTVRFTDDLGYANGVIDDFPDACGSDFWDDTQITVKVPANYTNIDADGDGEGDLIDAFGTFALTVETADGAESDSVNFVIRDDEAGPGICHIDPASGPAGTTTVTIDGDNFGSSQGSGLVGFYNGETVLSPTYWNDTEVRAVVPTSTESGPVFVTVDSGFDSNSQNYEVSDCAGDDANCSVTGTICCEDGSCSVTCEESIPESHYAWMFSTADIPAAPRVLVYCGDRDDDGTYDGVSPGPSNTWSQPTDICVNAAVSATFDRSMDTASYEANIDVTAAETCDTETRLCRVTTTRACSLDSDCPSTGVAVAGSVGASASATSFQWRPSENGGQFLPNTTYTVTLHAPAADYTGMKSAAGAYMARDYSWDFTTADSTDLCLIGSVYTSPSTYTAISESETVDYLGQPISAQDECVPLACVDYAWDWQSSNETEATVSPASVAADPASSCGTTATAHAETFGTPVDITAIATNPDGRDPEDSGELTINFTDPEVSTWAPSCETACVNGGIDATFNTDMDNTFVAGSNVTLYTCADSLCDTVSEGSLFSGTYGVTYAASTHSLNVSHDVFAASTWYRVVIDGTVTSTSGVELSESGSNYATADNLYYPNDFSWTFKTKSTDEPCAVDRVSISPSSATATYIGEQNLWEAIPYGAPDDCSASGQELDASGYDWSAWDATDNPDVHIDSARDVAGMLTYTSGSYTGIIERTSQLETGCSSDCLHVGSAATTDDAVCGNGSIEYGEECDGGSSCSSSCLHVAATACAYACDTSRAACASDATCSETCDTTTGFCTTNTSTACATDSDCPYDGGTCEQDTGCCGDGTLDAGEECDDGDSSSNNGCSSTCLNNGARRAGTACGDGIVDQSAISGGEDCDDGNTANGDGCSSDCLYEGGVAEEGIYATCGNGTVEDGEDCDDGNTDDEDGCSSDCLYEGASQCVYECKTSSGVTNGVTCSGIGATTCASGYACYPATSPCCGDGRTDYSAVTGRWSDRAEDCDDGNATNGDGCSTMCLNEGSNENYSADVGGPSYCGDGTVSVNTGGGGEECDASATATFDLGNQGVSVIKDAAAQEVLNGRAGAAITAGVSTPVVNGSADLTLTCSCELDSACGDETAYGCGTGSCCFARPDEESRYPNDAASDVCLNTLVYVDFTDGMDQDALAPSGEFPNMYLELTALDGGATSVNETNCPYAWTQVATNGNGSSSLIARAWNWIVSSVRALFWQNANAASYACLVPVDYSLSTNSIGGSRVTMSFADALEADATYQFVVVKDADETDASPDGVLSANGVSVRLTDSTNGETTTFETGSEICTLDVVRVEDIGITPFDELIDPSEGYFTSDGETHELDATAYTVSGGSLEPISETTSYGWDWTWGTSISDADAASNIVSVTTSDAVSVVATADGLTGRESAQAQANFSATNTFGDNGVCAGGTSIGDVCAGDADCPSSTCTEGGVSGSVALLANVCDNPPTVGFPYNDASTNFSFFYCRDAGVAGDTSDDLPELGRAVDVTSYTTDIIQELIWSVSGTSDAIGVRVLKNSSYLSAPAWYDAQGFTGSPTSISVDGYEAVRDGNTVYVIAANYSSSAVRVYPNVYVVSYTEDAESSSQKIFDQILANFSLNSNATDITDVNLCLNADGTYPTSPYECTSANGVSNGTSCSGATDTSTCGVGLTCQSAGFVTCEWDGDCVDVGTDASCDARKGKLTRDMRRLTDITDELALVGDYADLNGSCSVTTDQACTDDSQCPGTETCQPGTPKLSSGTFVSPYSVSAWPSWSATLGNALGEALPEDPINAFFQCDNACDAASMTCRLTGDSCASDADCASYESDTCWDATDATFTCPSGSHVYGYKSSGGIAYTLYAQLEFGNARWGYAIEPTGSFDTLKISQPYTASGTMPNGFVKATADPLCLGSLIGSTAICGDGIVGAGETCEIGDTSSDDCDDDGDGVSDGTGTITVTCESSCNAFQTAYEAKTAGASCVSYDCGNGVVEADNSETCDDGSLNGTYGHCGTDCTTDTAYSCGDGYLAGGEQCDCGETSNFSDVMADASSWASLNSCANSNGQWKRNPSGTCSWDCQYPGPSCGDGELNGSEVCDGDYDTWSGALCYGGDDDGETCSVDSDCDSGQCGSDGTSPDTYDACGSSAVCDTDGNGDGADDIDANAACVSDSDCDAITASDGLGTCSSFIYDLERTRTCQAACDWDTSTPGGWTACMGGSQVCGNGSVEGTEECDDGNTDDTDACTASCLLNVCGDGSVYSGVESCDSGDRNGETCEAPYESTCNYCTSTCQYKTTSGSYCGDGTINGTEFCDGAAVPGYCIDTSTGSVDRAGTCDTAYAGTSTGCDTGYTCHFMGVCNGGTANGEDCLTEYYGTDPDINADCVLGGGTCLAPTCADDCTSMCPFAYETASVQAETEESGSSPQDSVDLYSYNSGYSPDNAVFLIPACSVAKSLTADVDTSNVTAPNVDIVFVTDFTLTMGYFVDGEGGCDGSDTDTYADVDASGNRVTDCSDDAECGTGTCTEYAPAPYRRIDYVSAATVDAMSSLFASLEERGSVVQGAAVSFYNGVDADAGYVVDQGLTSSESSLETAFSDYATDTLQWWTPHYKGLAGGLEQLSGSTAEEKIVVMLSDGLPNYDKDGIECASTSDCIEEIATDLIPGLADDTKVFTAAITSSGSAKGYMAHISSDDCGTSYSSLSDCDPDTNNVEYAYQAEDADGIAAMYEDIVASILDVTVGVTSDFTGTSHTDTGTVGDGHGQTLPFPANFECDGTEMAIPFTMSFNGNGYATLSNMEVTYCPAL